MGLVRTLNRIKQWIYRLYPLLTTFCLLALITFDYKTKSFSNYNYPTFGSEKKTSSISNSGFIWKLGHFGNINIEYKLFPEKVTFDEAKRKCLSNGGYLPEIENEIENEYILRIAEPLEQICVNGIWLGIEFDLKYNRWIYSNSSKSVLREKWGVPKQQRMKYATMVLAESGIAGISQGFWRDVPTSTKASFICLKQIKTIDASGIEWTAPTDFDCSQVHSCKKDAKCDACGENAFCCASQFILGVSRLKDRFKLI